MENRTTHYYTLKYQHTDSLHKKGEVLVVPAGELYIGQQDDCKALFRNDSIYEDEQYAIIRPTRNKGEWQIIPTSEHITTSVNGMPVSLVHYLSDGDRITFDCESQELLFKVHHDERFDAAQGIQTVAAPISRKLLAFMIGMPILLLLLFIGYVVRANTAEDARNELLATLHPSVLQISVDSVLYVEMTPAGKRVLREYSYLNDQGHVISGTAFLTTDSCIVTARHCIEPWLNDPSIDEANSIGEVKAIPSRWAMEAETYNQTHESDTTYMVVAICDLYCGQNGTEKYGRAYHSTDFVVDRSRDNIIEKGGYDEEYYWRSIKETYSSHDMMLGDVAWLRTDSAGSIALATEAELTELLSSRQSFYFMGYPDHNTMRGFNTEEGRLQMDFTPGNMIAHNGNLIHGYSGAPVIVVKGSNATAVGVVSRLDSNGGGRTYSVPVTELKKKGGSK